MALVQSAKKGGRYTKKEQGTRRDEVFKLHMDYGYSARKIADIMKVNRNTINSDIKYCYSQLRKDDDSLFIEDALNKNIYRLEIQRSRCVERLEKTKDLRDILLLEKMIFGIDSKLNQIVTNLQASKEIRYHQIMRELNSLLEEKGN